MTLEEIMRAARPSLLIVALITFTGPRGLA